MAHAFNPSIYEAEADGSLELETSLVYSKFQDSQGYIEKACFGNKQTKKQIKQNERKRESERKKERV